MTSGRSKSRTKSKLKRAGETVVDGVADVVVNEALGAIVDVAAKALAGAGDALSCAGEVAADCGSVAVDVACNVAGSMLDGV